MDSKQPRNKLRLKARSVAEDLGFVALADVSTALETAAVGSYRLIGGHMVTLLVYRWSLAAELLRDTADADLGITPQLTSSDGVLLSGLDRLGYRRQDGSMLTRPVSDIPVDVNDSNTQREAIVDLLLPAFTSRARKNVTQGDVTTTEVRGLAEALNRPPVSLELTLVRLNDERLQATILLPDESDALTIKAFAWESRRDPKDAQDIWRCLEVASTAGVDAARFTTGDAKDARAILVRDFGENATTGIEAVARSARLNESARDQRHTRIKALLARVLGL
jgi:hypothetical protein